MKKAEKVIEILEKEISNPRIELNFSTPLELLVATILSAQCKDERVNRVTPELFRRFKEARDYAEADIKEIEEIIRPISFYRNKARMIVNCCKRIVEDFNGKVPDNLEDLVTLPGVGRKTANILLGNAFGKQAIAVDTHVKRVAQRLGLTTSQDPDRIEEDLRRQIPEDRWTRATNLLILHGRYTCKAKAPDCPRCGLRELCEYYHRKGG